MVFLTVYLEEVETSWLFRVNFYPKENFIIERTGVRVWLIGKTSSQKSRKTILLQLLNPVEW